MWKFMKKTAKQPRKRDQRRQINVKLSENVHTRLRTACEIQEHTEAKLARILIEWALPFYERTRSVEALKYLATRYFTRIVEDTPLEQSHVVSLEQEQVSQEPELVEAK